MNALPSSLSILAIALALGLSACGTPQEPSAAEPSPSSADNALVQSSVDGCTPQCAGKSCGFDGCFAQCGTCPSGQACEAGQCVSYTCVPECAGKACGSDGCGGSCGNCPEGESCVSATGTCNAAEVDPCEGITYEGCCNGQVAVWCEDGQLAESDCADDPVCGWVSDLGYYCGSDGGLDPSGALPKACPGTGSSSCTPNCQGVSCGPDGCGGSCGSCGDGASCQGGSCVSTGDGCGGITYDGCCDGETATWCEDGELLTDDCTQYDGQCGWVPGSGYYCESDGGTDPEGLVKACPGSAPSDPCGGITEEGCCQGQLLKWCEGNAIQSETCPGGCGWGDDEYDCNTDGGQDPTGTFPKACP